VLLLYPIPTATKMNVGTQLTTRMMRAGLRDGGRLGGRRTLETFPTGTVKNETVVRPSLSVGGYRPPSTGPPRRLDYVTARGMKVGKCELPVGGVN